MYDLPIFGAAVFVIFVTLFHFFSLRKFVFLLLQIWFKFNVFILWCKGKTPEGETERRVVTGQAWSDFCDEIKSAGAALVGPGAPKDAFSQAEGYRYLSRLVRAGLENFIECNDARAPHFNAIVNGYRASPIKIGSDNPDNLYQNAMIHGKYGPYRIFGKRGTVHYLGFGSQQGMYGEAGGLKTIGHIDVADIDVCADGSFELLVSTSKPVGQNIWMPLAEGVGLIQVRQTFLDRESEVAAEVHIERVSEDRDPIPFDAARLEKALSSTSKLVCGASMMFSNWAREFKAHANTLPPFNQQRSNDVGGDPNIRYYHSYWTLLPTEALVIRATVPACDHWNFQLNNFWLESLDYRYFTVHVNKHSARLRVDGSVVVVVSANDPAKMLTSAEDCGEYSWLSTVAHTQGTMTWRWIKPQGNVPIAALPQPRTKVVQLKDIAQFL